MPVEAVSTHPYEGLRVQPKVFELGMSGHSLAGVGAKQESHNLPTHVFALPKIDESNSWVSQIISWRVWDIFQILYMKGISTK